MWNNFVRVNLIVNVHDPAVFYCNPSGSATSCLEPPHDGIAQGQVNQRPLRTGTPDSTDHILDCTSFYTGEVVQNLKRGVKEGRSSVQISTFPRLGLFRFLLLYSIECLLLSAYAQHSPLKKEKKIKLKMKDQELM